jgi:hypothetical protein
MRRQDEAGRVMRRMGQLVGLVALSVLPALFLFSSVGAQETPTMTPENGVEPTAQAPTDAAVLRLEVDAAEQPIPKGDEFEVTVLVDNVEHLAAFGLSIQYDPKRLEPVERELPEEATPLPTSLGSETDGGGTLVSARDVGAFLADSERGEGMICPDPSAKNGEVVLSCVTIGPPVCLDGLAGASGSGVLGRVLFKSKGGGTTTLGLANTSLALDDAEPCDPAGLLQPPVVPHQVEGATIELAETGGIPWMIVGPIIAVVVIVVIGGGVGGFLWSRRGGTGTPPPSGPTLS